MMSVKVLVPVLFVLFLLSSCSKSILSSTSCGSSERLGYLYDHGRKYAIFMTDDLRQYYEVYDTHGKVVISDTVEQPLKIEERSDDIIDICIGYGTGVSKHIYYDISKNQTAGPFFYVLAMSGKRIVYLDVPETDPFTSRRLIVCDLFAQNGLWREIPQNAFKGLAHIDMPFSKAVFLDGGETLELYYYSDNGEMEITQRFSLS